METNIPKKYICHEAIGQIIFRITEKLIDNYYSDPPRIPLNDTEIDEYKKYIKILMVNLDMEYSHIIFMIIFIEKILQICYIDKKNNELKYLFAVASLFALKFCTDLNVFVSDISENTNVDIRKCINLEKKIFKHIFMNMNYSFDWEKLYNQYDFVFNKYLNLILTEYNAAIIIQRNILKEPFYNKIYTNYMNKTHIINVITMVMGI